MVTSLIYTEKTANVAQLQQNAMNGKVLSLYYKPCLQQQILKISAQLD